MGYQLSVVLLLLTICLNGCQQESNWEETFSTPDVAATAEVATAEDRPGEPWISQPHSSWPQLVLTNEAQFRGHTPLEGASSFLIQTREAKVYAATAAHLIGANGGVEPDIPIPQLTSKIVKWRMYPRTLPDRYVHVNSLAVQTPWNSVADMARDWLILNLSDPNQPLPAHPLRIRNHAIATGESIYLVGCPYSEPNCKQNVYKGTVTERAYGGLFSYTLDPPVDLTGFSGAPIIDSKGFVVGVVSVWFSPRMSGDKYLEGGGEDVVDVEGLLSDRWANIEQ